MEQPGSGEERQPSKSEGDTAPGLSDEKRAAIDRSIARAHQVGKDFPLPKHPGLNELGFGYVEFAIVVALLAALAGFGRWMYVMGENAKQLEWNKAELDRGALERDRNKAVGVALLLAEKARMAAEDKARVHENLWKETRRENRRTGKQLGSCGESAPDPAPPIGAADVARRTDLRLHWRFVGMHDGAFTGLDGQPLFGASAEFSLDPARADTASPYTLDDVADVAGENAFGLSACRRAIRDARRKLEDAAAAWDQEKRGAQ